MKFHAASEDGEFSVIYGEGSLREQSKICFEGFPGGAVVENPPANAGDTGSIPGLGRSHMPWSN